MRFLLVHSPAVGPATWRWVADALRSRGHEAVVPNLVAAAQTGEPAAFAQAAVQAVDPEEDTVICGHSAAGGVLPVVAGLVPGVRRVVFVDASVPPCEGTTSAGGEFLGALRGLAADGVLPVWSRWWGEGVLEALVPDETRRRAIETELPAVPLAFFEAPITLPAGWCDGECAFVLLSEFYRPDATRAAALGWPVVERQGAHLDLAKDEEAIAGILAGLAERP